ncbi:hypothetical protein B0H19DRAFT_111911 [Mycena capillaripes]|nr:hypothetical protein B0H19DRAFT_111911 [Mycena capillaripes]
MYSKTVVASVALLAVAAPAIAAPLPLGKGAPGPSTNPRDLDLATRGVLGDLLSKLTSAGETGIEDLLKNVLVGSNFAGRDLEALEARGALGDLLSKLTSAGETGIEDLLKAALGARAIGKGAPAGTPAPARAPTATGLLAGAPLTALSSASALPIATGLPAGQAAQPVVAPIPTDDSGLPAGEDAQPVVDQVPVDDSGHSDGAPADDLEARGILGDLLSKLTGPAEQGIESIIKNALGGLGGIAGRGFITSEVESLAEKGIGAIISKFFGKRALADLDDEEVVRLLAYVAAKNTNTPSKRGFITSEIESLATKGIGSIISKLFGKRALADLDDDEVVRLLAYVADKKTSTQTKRELAGELEARGILGELLSKLTGPAEQGIESIIKNALGGLGGIAGRGFITSEVESLAEKGIGAIISKFFGKRALADLDDEEVVRLLAYVAAKNSNTPSKRGFITSEIESLATKGIGAIISKLFGKRALADLDDEEVVRLLAYVADKKTSTQTKRELAGELDARGILGDLLSKLTGPAEQSIESIIKNALGGLGGIAGRGFITSEVESLAEKGIGAIISKFFGKRALADLDDEEVVRLLAYVASKNQGKRETSLNDLD